MNADLPTQTSQSNLRAGAMSDSADAPTVMRQPATMVTIVVCFRERWRFTQLTIEAILKNTNGDYALWLLDSGMPENVREALRPYVAAGRLEIIDAGERRQPTDLRGFIAPRLASTYAIFLDNDAIVLPGWLDNMLACAEETGAGIVSPLYLWGDQPESDLIHMAGGDLSMVPEDGGFRMDNHHRHFNRTIPQVADDLRREKCDFGEFHCLMMRRELYSAPGMFDPGVVSVHAHIHASLIAKELGYDTWFEPQARVNYVAFGPWLTGELHDLRRIWNFTTAEQSLAYFAKRWRVVDDDAYRHYPLAFVTSHVGRADVLDPRPRLANRRDRIMTGSDLQQTFAGCAWLAVESGYTIDDVQVLANAYCIAIEIMNGLYRSCGRPFLNHLLGTASILLFYGCPIHLVVAGMLHAILNAGLGLSLAQSERALCQLEELGSTGIAAAKLVRLYSDCARLLEGIDLSDKGAAELPAPIAALYVLHAANDVEIHLSFEAPATGRVRSEKRIADSQAVLDYVGLPGLAASLRMVREQAVQIPTVNFLGGVPGSFRLDDTRIVPANSQRQVV